MKPLPGRIFAGETAPGLADRDVVLDVSRLLSRVLHATPTGVDRVEMAYARGLLATIPDRLAFAALHPAGIYGRLDRSAVLAFLDETEARWADRRPGRWALRLGAARACLKLRPGPVPPLAPGRTRVYVQSSPHHLERQRRVAAILRREQARLICLVHDLIPIEYPEYARPNGARVHRSRVATMAALADGLVTNSEATRASLRRQFGPAHQPLIHVAHLGTHPVPPLPEAGTADAPDPYFICIGTIEPRKNHLLLLNIWRRMVEQAGPAAVPRLVIVGRRGWENEQVIDMLERCPALAGRVEEHSGLPDRAMAELIGHARALLLPSFAEGFGMPVTEALGAGVPVICSDLPALREAGGSVPDFLDPLDGGAWIRIVKDYAKADSALRAAQLDRLSRWKPPGWTDHIAILLDLIGKV
jgi:glycosyltransferase involved in cell wall biosynthesis